MDENLRDQFKMIDDLLASKYYGIVTDKFLEDVKAFKEKKKDNFAKDSDYVAKCLNIDKDFETYIENIT